VLVFLVQVVLVVVLGYAIWEATGLGGQPRSGRLADRTGAARRGVMAAAVAAHGARADDAGAARLRAESRRPRAGRERHRPRRLDGASQHMPA
jgi:hypothetical protein